jgi:medium-chain acyl-[acyl-carrier-protein] hydrolase
VICKDQIILSANRETLNTNASSAAWFSIARPNPYARMRLFCFPYAGGSSFLFHKWNQYLPSSVEICTAQLPGRAARTHEPAFHAVRPLIEALGPAIYPFLEKPFAFFGHSMGAIIAFELTLYLRREYGLLPSHLFVSGRRAPQVARDEPQVYDLPYEEFISELRRLDGTPPEALEHPELMELMMPLLRADFALVDTYNYRPEPPLECGITAYGGSQDQEVSCDELKAWRRQTRSAFRLQMMAGGHFFVQNEPEDLLRSLYSELLQLVGKEY